MTSRLSELLEAAATGESSEAFYLELLESEVVIPTRSAAKANPQPGDTFETFNFLTAREGSKEILPIFSDAAFVEEWAGRELPTRTHRFTSLLWILADEIWLHLNPGQEFGKELSPWEIERLKQGKDAVPELISELDPPVAREIEIDAQSDNYPELRLQMRPVLELYREISEAFIVKIAEGEEIYPAVGLRRESISPERLASLQSELNDSVSGHLSQGERLAIFENVDDRSYRAIFEDATPFYVRLAE